MNSVIVAVPLLFMIAIVNSQGYIGLAREDPLMHDSFQSKILEERRDPHKSGYFLPLFFDSRDGVQQRFLDYISQKKRASVSSYWMRNTRKSPNDIASENRIKNKVSFRPEFDGFKPYHYMDFHILA